MTGLTSPPLITARVQRTIQRDRKDYTLLSGIKINQHSGSPITEVIAKTLYLTVLKMSKYYLS